MKDMNIMAFVDARKYQVGDIYYLLFNFVFFFENTLFIPCLFYIFFSWIQEDEAEMAGIVS